MRNARYLSLALAALLAAAAAEARQGGRFEPFKREMYPPELVMAHQREIGLSGEQRELFIREMRQAQSDLLPVQLEMSEASAELLELLEGPRVDEEAALAAARRVLELERRVKGRHLVLLIRIKNMLTEEQQRRLREIRDGG